MKNCLPMIDQGLHCAQLHSKFRIHKNKYTVYKKTIYIYLYLYIFF